MRAAAITLSLLVLGVALLVMTAAALQGGDWPGWDEGWALVTFPLGIPVAVATGLAASRRNLPWARIGRLSLVATLAVWLWGAAIFAAWYAFA